MKNDDRYQINVKLNQRTDKDIIETLEDKENKMGYIKELILKDIDKSKEDDLK